MYVLGTAQYTLHVSTHLNLIRILKYKYSYFPNLTERKSDVEINS